MRMTNFTREIYFTWRRTRDEFVWRFEQCVGNVGTKNRGNKPVRDDYCEIWTIILNILLADEWVLNYKYNLFWRMEWSLLTKETLFNPQDNPVHYFADSVYSNRNHLFCIHPSLKIWKSMSLEQWILCYLSFIHSRIRTMSDNCARVTIRTPINTKEGNGWKRVGCPFFILFPLSRLNFSFFTAAVSATVIRQFSELCPRFGTSVQRDAATDTPADIVPECNRKHCLASRENVLEESIKSITL